MAQETVQIICLRCRTTRSGGTTCPVCDPASARANPRGEREASPEWCELSPVFEAPNEIAAISVQAVLEEDGIPAIVRSTLVPNYGGLAMTLAGCWGWVLVPKDEAARARSTVEAYLRSLGVEPPNQGSLPEL